MKSTESQRDFQEHLPETPLEEPPRRQRKWLWLLLLPLLLGGGFLAWRFLNQPNQAQQQSAAPPPAPVKLAPVQAGAIEDSSDFIARLDTDPNGSVILQPRIQGLISKIFVNPGAFVRKETPIIQIDPRQQQAAVSGVNAAAEASRSQLDNARAKLNSLEADKASNEADVKLNQSDYQRYSSLAAQGAVSRQTKEQYANKLATAEAKLRSTIGAIQAQQAAISQAQKSLQQAQANTRQQQVELQYYTITAPGDGTVGDIPVKVGQFVNTNTQLTTITQSKTLEVKISVPVEMGPQLRQGMPVEILDGQNRVLATSKISFIAPYLSNNTQSILVKANLDNSKGQLRTDQFARARVIWNQRVGVLVPTTAIARVAGENFVYVGQTQQSPQGKSQLVARQKRVKLGIIKGNNYQVLDGIQPGERIIVSGLLNLRDGVPIMPES